MTKFKQILMTSAVLAGLGAGGAAFANAQTGSPSTSGKATAAQTAAPEHGETNDGPGGDRNEAADQVTGTDAASAKTAALAAVDGKVTEVAKETPDAKDATDKADTPEKGDKPDAADKTDKPEKGDTHDPAYESRIAYDVEVTKTDGGVVDVHLDKAFKVLGTEKADHGDHGDQGSQGADQGDGDGENPAA
ncbi:hypothetical protein [Patulibacter minatonensis]|uniref:hypothetical protein n=1 Tax=Patulibacter minatonensis TaxID=298163 RepID=UPI00047992D3|nr:hypothetical protein [Patulibacter minatonensis]